MSVARTKRRYFAWERYYRRNRKLGAKSAIYTGHAKAFSQLMYQRRWVPIGVRRVWLK